MRMQDRRWLLAVGVLGAAAVAACSSSGSATSISGTFDEQAARTLAAQITP